jgi:phosphoserine phosphatase
MARKREIVMINIYGPDRPGIISVITEILGEHGVSILDIGQAVIHNSLNLGILVELNHRDSAPVLKDLLFKGYEMGITVRFTPVSEETYNSWVDQQGKERFIITLISRKLTAEQISKVTFEILNQGLNIDVISRLTGRIPLNANVEYDTNSKSVVEFSVRGKPRSVSTMKSSFIDLSKETGIDIAFQEDNLFRRNRRLVCFDMDSTLIQTEVIDELAKHAGVGAQVSKITESAMRGEIDFKESFKQRVALLNGLDESVMKDIAEKLPLTEGCERLFKTLHKFGYKTAILSGGFTYFGNYLKNKLGIDYVFANELEIIEGKLTGNYVGEIVDGNKKAEYLKLIAFKEDLHLQQVIAVGDGSNDLPMINLAGLGIAFHAKPVVKANASHSISNIGLDAILYLLGMRDREIEL